MKPQGYLIEKYDNMGGAYTCRRLRKEAVARDMELDMLGIITARVKSCGRQGRTKEIEKVSENIVDILERDEIFNSANFSAFRKGKQTQFNVDS